MAIENEQCFEPKVLNNFLTEQLSEREEAQMVAHLDQCGTCQVAL